MSRTFNDSLRADLETTFFNPDEFAQEVTLKRVHFTTTGVAAISATRSYDSVDQEGFTTSVESTDFDIIANKYVIRGELVEPRDGDLIIDGNGREYQVLPLDGKKCFEPTGGGGFVLRVHTKRVA